MVHILEDCRRFDQFTGNNNFVRDARINYPLTLRHAIHLLLSFRLLFTVPFGEEERILIYERPSTFSTFRADSRSRRPEEARSVSANANARVGMGGGGGGEHDGRERAMDSNRL